MNNCASGKKNKAATVLHLDNKIHYIDAYKNNETCWEYYLSPGTRLYRRLRTQNGKEYPIMLCIRFESSGAANASIGWSADHTFNNLSPREKALFWRYVVSQFPGELQDCFIYQNNAIFLAVAEEKALNKRHTKIFPAVADIQKFIDTWIKNQDGKSLIEQMFSQIEKAVKDFNI